MHSDPIADMLTRVRNAVANEAPWVEMPASRVKASVADVLRREGFIWDWVLDGEGTDRKIRINLKYGPNGERVLNHLKRVSKPGCRVYRGVPDMGRVRRGIGILIVSTSSGMMSNKEARTANVGGEVVAEIW